MEFKNLSDDEIRQALTAAWQDILEEEEAVSLEEYLRQYRKYLDDPDFSIDGVPQVVIRAIERLVGRQFVWHWEPVYRQPDGFTGEFSFIAVDPETQRCLTFKEWNYNNQVFHSINVSGTVLYLEDLVFLVKKLLGTILPALVLMKSAGR